MLSAHIKGTNSSSVLPDQTCRRFTLSQIQSATRNFDETLIIGRGGFGNVYKCASKIGLVNKVAVKRLHSMSNQGAHEFEAEVKVLSKLRHGNLVSLIGYCNEEKEMVLVYELMSNGTLEDHLRTPDASLSWLQLLKICIGAARGLDYLHTGTSTREGVIHRDVKSSNILLDANFDAKISDFGLAKIWQIDGTHVSTGVKGTFGYMDPFYFYTGKLTIKFDVYAFGVVLLEVLTGKKALDDTIGEQWGLAGWAQHQIKQGKLNQIIDPRLVGQISKKCLKEFARIAGSCLHSHPSQRPTMAEVVVKLEFILSQERERANSAVDEEGFIYKIRSLFTGKVETATGSKSDFTLHHEPLEIITLDTATGSVSDFSSHQKPLVSIVDAAIESKTNQSLKMFTYDELVTATNDFKYFEYSPRIQEFIYKGWTDEKMEIPKRDIKLEDFSHPNLVKLLGYCLHTDKLLCVYEVMSGITLDQHLYGEARRSSLSWVARLNIAKGAAEGLLNLYKSNHKAVYSPSKTDLIFVDTDCNARLLDISFHSKQFGIDASYYHDPEWIRYQGDKLDGFGGLPDEDGFRRKSEIYSFGVVLLEILTGMKVYDDERPPEKINLVEWAVPLLADEVNLGKILDPQLLQHNDNNNCPPKGAFKFAQLVSNCCQPNQYKRPLMEEILQVLNHCYQEQIEIV